MKNTAQPNGKNNGKKKELAPVKLVHVGKVKTKHPVVSLIEYDNGHFKEGTLKREEVLNFKPPAQHKLWLNVHGLQDADLIAEIGRIFKLHPLVLEDILNTSQRPKMDNYEGYLYIVMRYFSYDKTRKTLSSEQISLILGENFVLTFQEKPTGSFEPTRQLLRTEGLHIRTAKTDYLAYALLDALVDRYYFVLEDLSIDCEKLENQLLRKPTGSLLHSIHRLKRESMELRRSVWPLREVLNNLIRNDHGAFEATTILYLRDVYDHTVAFIESLESIRDMLAGMLDIYLSSISNRVNMELRALTVVAMLFMPATLIAGIFGMNFEYMPWLNHHNGFWWALALMAGVATVMGTIFWRRQWLSQR